jgi:hypothetical protein
MVISTTEIMHKTLAEQLKETNVGCKVTLRHPRVICSVPPCRVKGWTQNRKEAHYCDKTLPARKKKKAVAGT